MAYQAESRIDVRLCEGLNRVRGQPEVEAVPTRFAQELTDAIRSVD
jgi:hypothetical protein